MRWIHTPFLILAIVVSFTLRVPLVSAVAYPTVVASGAQGFASSDPWTLSATTLGTGDNNVLIVLAAQGGACTVPTSVTYGGAGMTKIVDLACAQQGQGVMWCLSGYTPGTADIVVNFGANKGGYIIWAELQDAVQDCATIVDVSGQANQASGSSVSKAVVTTVDGDLVIGWAVVGGSGVSITPDAPQVEFGSDVGDTNATAEASSQPKETAGSITSGVTWSGTRSADYYVAALKYQAPSAAGPSYQLWPLSIF